MIDLLKEKLSALGCDAWELTECREDRWEFYFIGQRLDQNRSVQICDTKVKVYRKSEDGKYLGSAVDVISPVASEEEIDRTLDRLFYQAGLVKNPVYTITDVPVTVEEQTMEEGAAAIARDCLTALSGMEINSHEIFVSRITRTTLNSHGVSYRCTYPVTEIEVVVNARDEKQEIELHRIFHSGTCDRDKLRGDVERVLAFGRDRLKAGPTPKLGRGDVLLSTEDAVSVYDYFADRMHADYIVRKISDCVIGECVAREMKGDPLTLTAFSSLPNSSMNYPVDEEGNLIFERDLIRENIAVNYVGSRQFSQYLGLERSSLLTNLKVSGGRRGEEELRRGNYLEVVEFSDFQVDSMSGDIAGEIRLGYWHHDGEVDIVTGGSVSGSMNEVARELRFSRETVQYNNREIPRVTLLRNMRITGV